MPFYVASAPYIWSCLVICVHIIRTVQEKKEFASSFISNLVKQLVKHMACYEHPLEKMLYQKHKHTAAFQEKKTNCHRR
jgi:hypothetical protein